MVITKMNNVLVKHSRILFGLFTGIIIISFVWFFTPGASGNILFGSNRCRRTRWWGRRSIRTLPARS